ncbi:MAG: hypothetical protein U0T69_11210 [Chitinophagales bacterium]
MSNGTENKLISFDPLFKREKRGNKSVKIEKKPTIKMYQDTDGGWHCDIDVNGYVYGAIRHTIEDIERFAIRQTVVQLGRGIDLVKIEN